MTDLTLQATKIDLAINDTVIDLSLVPDVITLDFGAIGPQGAKGDKGDAGAPGSAGATYKTIFTNTNLSVVGILAVTHNLNTYPSAVMLWNAVGEQIFPDAIDILTTNMLSIDLSSFVPLVGTYSLSIAT
jgi:hypothetical protein